MPGRPNAVDAHPKRNDIINRILGGESLQSIANRFNLSAQSVSRFKQKVIRPAISRRDLARAQKVSPDSVSDAVQVVSEIKSLIPEPGTLTPTIKLLERKWERYDRMAAKAEADGNVQGWASVDRAETSALQLRAQLLGETASQAPTNVQVAILIPPPPASGADGGQVLNVDARQVPLERGDSGRSNGDNSEE